MRYHLAFDLQFTTNTYSGKYYAIEGIDGSGKTTQVQYLADHFIKQGKKVFITKEPTDEVIGSLIHQVLQQKIEIPAISLQYLFCADRAVHLQKEVIPALKDGKIVLSDRSLWSSVAYGITDLSLEIHEKERLLMAYNLLAMYGGFLIPDKTFFLEIPAEIAMQRMDARNKEKTIYEKTEKLKKIEKEYEWLAREFGDFITIIEGNKNFTIEEVHKEILRKI